MSLKRSSVGLLVLALAYLLFWPTHLRPYAWTPPKNPGTGPGSPFRPTLVFTSPPQLGETLITNRFSAAGKPENFGPEDVAVGPVDGRIYTGLGDGRILSIDPDSGAASVFANTGGRPLGVSFGPPLGTLYVADAELGLVSVDPSGRVSVLVNEVDGDSFKFADNLKVAPDGSVWFSAPTREHTLEQIHLDVIESRPTGRLLHYDPASGRTQTVLDNLFYANGVAVAEDGSFVLVAEFLAFRIQRYWITGPCKGSHEVFVDGLPGYPDNITRTPEGTFLVGLSLARIALLDKLRPMPWAVDVLARLPTWLAPKPRFPGYLLEFDGDGNLRRFLADETRGEVAQITAAAALPASGGPTSEVVAGSLVVNGVRRLQLGAQSPVPSSTVKPDARTCRDRGTPVRG
jgi:sugar lactone lactonase YvrE